MRFDFLEQHMLVLLGDLRGVAYIVIALAYMWLAKLVSDMVAGYDANHEIGEESNLAVGLRRAGFYLAIPIGMYGAIAGPSQGFVTDLRLLLIDGLFITLFMFAARAINDWFVIHGVNNTSQVKEGNVAVALAECGGYIATGIIAWASFSGQGGGVGSAIVFFILGQLTLLLVTRVYEQITPWSVIQNICDGNRAAGLMIGGLMVAVSIAIFGAIAGDFTGWVIDITSFAIHAVIAIVLLMVLSTIVDHLFLVKTDVRTEIERDQNVAAIAVVIVVKVALALMINAGVV